jgi:hypothetical protein
VFDEVEHVVDLMEDKAHRLREFVSEDMERFIDETVEEVLDRLIKSRTEGEQKDYLEVPPNPDDFGVQPEDVYDDPSKDEKVWTPDDDGDGKVPIFRPEEDDSDQD